jgi:hypothetical protein
MRAFPPLPDVADAPSSLLDGHLWLQEYVAGGGLRFQLQESGLLVFGDEDRVFDDEVPLGYRAAVRHVREHFDREALRAAIEDVEAVTFSGVATRDEGVTYDWDDLPAFLGFDVHDGRDDDCLPPDAVERLYDELGLAPLNAVQKEVRGADFDPATYDTPDSAWRDGRAAGVFVRNKTGDRAKLLAATDDATPPQPTRETSELADALVTDRRVARARDSVTTGGTDAVAERVLEIVAREAYATILGDDASVDRDDFESAVGERTRRRLDDL